MENSFNTWGPASPSEEEITYTLDYPIQWLDDSQLRQKTFPDDIQKNNSARLTLRTFFYNNKKKENLLKSSRDSNKTLLQVGFKELFSSGYLNKKIIAIRKNKAKSTFDYDADFVPFDKMDPTPPKKRAATPEKVRCPCCWGSHLLIECKKYTEEIENYVCSICKNKGHTEKDCLLSDQPIEGHCFKCGSKGHLYCIKTGREEGPYLYSDEEDDNDAEEPGENGSLNEKISNNNQNFYIFEKSSLIHNKNFYDSDDELDI